MPTVNTSFLNPRCSWRPGEVPNSKNQNVCVDKFQSSSKTIMEIHIEL